MGKNSCPGGPAALYRLLLAGALVREPCPTLRSAVLRAVPAGVLSIAGPRWWRRTAGAPGQRQLGASLLRTAVLPVMFRPRVQNRNRALVHQGPCSCFAQVCSVAIPVRR